MKRALCLQGGGAKGAFQAGALKALTERGYRFDCAVGASVGSLNAAMVCLGKVDELYRLWEGLDFADVLPVQRNTEGSLSLRSIASAAFDAIRSSGVDTDRIRAILERNVDEQAVRASGIRFGLVTVKDDGKNRTLCKYYIEDIPQGRLIDFMMASAALPFFKRVEIDGVHYLDGGMMDNLPIEMLADAGYRKITAIRLGGDIRYASSKPLDITYIDPSESPGHTINFSNASITHSLHLGYYDTIRMLDGLYGKKYYIKPFKMRKIRRFLKARKQVVAALLAENGLNAGWTMRERTAALTCLLSDRLDVKGSAEEIWTAFAEQIAKGKNKERWHIYTIEELLSEGGDLLDWGKRQKEAGNKSSLFGFVRGLFKEKRNG